MFIKKWKESDLVYIHPGILLLVLGCIIINYCMIITPHLVNALKKKATSKQVAASDLKYTEATSIDKLKRSGAHFVGIKLQDISSQDEAKREDMLKTLKKNLITRGDSLKKAINPFPPVFKCRESISENYGFLLKGIEKEAEVRFVYADPLVKMLCQAFKYKLELEDTMDEARNDSMVTVSDKSRADYVCWTLKSEESGTRKEVCVVVLETKHKDEINDEGIAQLLGYYCKGKGAKDNQTGVAILLNVWQENVDVRIFLFPYGNESNGYGIQSLMFPVYSCHHEQFILGEFIDLFLIMCMQDKPVLLELSCPTELPLVRSSDIVGVYTDAELREKRIQELETEKVNQNQRQDWRLKIKEYRNWRLKIDDW